MYKSSLHPLLVFFSHMHNQLSDFFFILKSCPGICKQNKDCAECFAFGTGLYNSSVCQRECTNVRTAAILEPASEYTEQCHSGIYATTTCGGSSSDVFSTEYTHTDNSSHLINIHHIHVNISIKARFHNHSTFNTQ